MAAIPVVLNGTFTSDAGSTVGVFQGTMAYSDRAPGGGPIVPPSGPVDPGYGIPEKPADPGYFPPRPAHPIVLPPVEPGGPPIDIGAHPEHPIVLPDPPVPPDPPETVTVLKPPPATGGWGAVSTYGWAYYPGAGQPGPKS